MSPASSPAGLGATPRTRREWIFTPAGILSAGVEEPTAASTSAAVPSPPANSSRSTSRAIAEIRRVSAAPVAGSPAHLADRPADEAGGERRVLPHRPRAHEQLDPGRLRPEAPERSDGPDVRLGDGAERQRPADDLLAIAALQTDAAADPAIGFTTSPIRTCRRARRYLSSPALRRYGKANVTAQRSGSSSGPWSARCTVLACGAERTSLVRPGLLGHVAQDRRVLMSRSAIE